VASSLIEPSDAHPAAAPAAGSVGLTELTETATRIQAAVATVIEGKPAAIKLALTVLLAEGHLLIEDVPGVGKTMLAKSLARSIDCSVQRIQFTPDLMPSDVTGVSVFNQQTRDFDFKPGGIFANIVVGDEINRASPKTQSALLEAMEERQVTVDRTTYHLDPPFMVVATQNPIEMEGTYPLPEAQRDRFMIRLSMGYPGAADEIDMLSIHGGPDRSSLETLEPVTDATRIAKLVEIVRGIHVSAAVKNYAVSLADATRRSPDLRLGASPRATLHLVKAGKAWAALNNREYVLPDDIQHLAAPVLSHRLLPTADAQIGQRNVEGIIATLVSKIAVPDATRI
jgi:MoxR-like ATPase